MGMNQPTPEQMAMLQQMQQPEPDPMMQQDPNAMMPPEPEPMTEAPTQAAPQQSSQDPFEMTERHIALVVNQVLTAIAGSLKSKTAFDAAKSLDPLTNVFQALHGGMVQSRQARATQADPAAQFELEKMKIQHQHALDLMANMHDEQNMKFKQQLEQQKAEHQMQIAEQKAKAEEERAGLQNAQIASQIKNQQEQHEQQTQHTEENHLQTLSNTDEMHKTQVQQAKAKPTESGSEN